ncbi:N,N'-diacetyllegionaminate synthase [Clostridium sp. CTA-7]
MEKHIFIIAEAGVNHNGSIENAMRLIDKAKDAGVDAVKFQTFKASNIVSKKAKKADYQIKNTKSDNSQYEMLKKLELNHEDHIFLSKYCREKNILFLSTAFDLDSIDILEELDVPLHKIPSGEITNLPYLEKIAKTGKPLIMSTGMSEIKEIEDAIRILKKNGAKEITVLHCNTEYPTPFGDVNLKAMKYIKEKLDVDIGYSDHTIGIEVPIAAAALGASVIEKHFTLDKEMEGPDHKASLNPEELQMMVKSIRNIEEALGCRVKKVTESEKKNIKIARKSIVAKKCIKKGELLTENNITVKRPGNGISPMKWYDILGTIAIKDFNEDELIEI